METYIFKIAPDYTGATYYPAAHGAPTVAMEEWQGRSWADFHRGMQGRGFTHTTETYTLPGRGEFTEHSYTRRAR